MLFPSLHSHGFRFFRRPIIFFALLLFLVTPLIAVGDAEAKGKAHVVEKGKGKKSVSDKSLKHKKKSEKTKSKKTQTSSSSDNDPAEGSSDDHAADTSPLDGASSEAPKEDLLRRAVLFFNRQNGATKEVPLKSEELQKAAEQFLKTASDSSVDSPPAVNDGESVSRKFMKIFDKREEKTKDVEVSSAGRLIEERGVTVNQPEGWVVEKTGESADPDQALVIALTQAGEPNNRIEVRKGINIAPSKRLQYLDSFRTNVENAGFEPDFEMGENSEKALHVKRRFGEQTGDYIKFHVGDVDVTNPLRGNTKVGLLLFLFEGKEDAWIFAAFSTVGEIDQIEPIFQKFIETAQFTAK